MFQGRRTRGQVIVDSALTLAIVVLAGAALWAMGPQERPYPGLAPAARELQQGLDYLDVDPNTPFHTEAALRKFQAAAAAEGAGPATRERAAFLQAWAAWAQATPDYPAARAGFERFLSAPPGDPFLRAMAAFMLGLVETHAPDADDQAAVRWFEEAMAGDPGHGLGAQAASVAAGVCRDELDDWRRAVTFYEAAFQRGASIYTMDERLSFLYIKAKLLQGAGMRQPARETYQRVLDLSESGAGVWTDRVLDRLEEMGFEPEGDYFGGVEEDPPPMTSHRYAADEPVEISVSFWILEKAGMRRGIEQIVENYERRTRGVDVKLIDLPYEGYHEWLQSQILGQEIPDIVHIDNATAIRYGAYQGRLLEMSQFLGQTNPYTGMRWSEMFHPQFILNARDPVYYKNWIVSYASENTAFFYNKRAFRGAGIVERDAQGRPRLGPGGKAIVDEPETWAELMAAFARLRDHGYYGEVCEFYPDPAPLIWQQPYLRRQLYDNLIPKLDVFTPDDNPDSFEIAKAYLDGTLNLFDPELAEMWRLLYDKSEYWAPGSTSLNVQEAFEFFAKGESATLFWVSTDLSSLEERCDFEIGVFPFPLVTSSPYYDGPYSQEFTLSAFEFAVPKVVEQRGHMEAVVDFLMYFTSPEAQEILSREAVCVSPIKGVPVPERLEPFMARVNQRGTHQVWFDPFAIGIVKEPYAANARHEVWNALGRMVGTIPNFEYYQAQIGGDQHDYAAWRREHFRAFLRSLQEYFTFAYDRIIREYPVDAHREIVRSQHRWISDFRALYAPAPGQPEPDFGPERLAEGLRGISDNLGVIELCAEILEEQGEPPPDVAPPLSQEAQRDIGRVVRIAAVLAAAAGLIAALWAGTLWRLIRDMPLIAIIAPTLILLGLFSYAPALSAIYHAFFRWNGADVSEFTGLANFHAMLTDGVLHKSVGVMAVFLAANIVKFAPTVFVAVLLFHLASPKLQYGFRVVFVLPMAIPTMVGLLIWKYFYRMDGGVLNSALMALGLLDAPVNWLGTEGTVVPALLFIGFPWVSTIGVLILLAGLQNIPSSVFESATLDGCSPWKRFTSIEMPLIMGQIKLNIVLVTIGTIQDFWLPLVLTRGGPNNASMLPGLWMYQNAFTYGKMGYAAALGLMMFLVILTLTFINLRIMRSDPQ